MAEGDPSAGGGESAGLIASLRRGVSTALAIVHTRLELFGNELEHERLRLMQLFILASVALFCTFVGAVLATLLIVVAFWDDHRLAALGILAFLYLGAGAVVALLCKARAVERPHVFQQSLAELARDRDALRSR